MRSREIPGVAIRGLLIYVAASVPVAIGVLLASDCCKYRGGERQDIDLARALDGGDGKFYLDIATRGYTYTPGEASNVAFFPAFPIATAAVAAIAMIPATVALPITSNCFCAAAFGALLWYARQRVQWRIAGETARGGDRAMFAVLAMALMPPGFYFRMGYSEAIFLFAAILSMRAIASGWSPMLAALIVGLTTATRPVGVALLVPLLAFAWRRSTNLRGYLVSLLYLVPLGTWGVAAYMLFQYSEFGDALAFAKTQAHYSIVEAPSGDKLGSLLSLTPIWSVYDPTSPGYWSRFRASSAVLNLQFAQPIYFCGAAALTCIGWRKRWLSIDEALLSAGLLVIPYLTRSFEMSMVSHGRFAAVVFPVYFVVAELLCHVGPLGRFAMIITCSSLVLGYTFYFAVGSPIR